MKSIRTKKLLIIYFLPVVFLFIAGISGCAKTTPASGTISTSSLSYLSVMNLAPYGSSAQIYLSGVQYTQIFPVGSFTTSYISYPSGNYEVEFETSSSDSLMAEIPSFSFDSLGFYTVIMYNDSANGVEKAAIITDNFSNVNPSSDSAYYRFFNMSPDMPAVDLYINSIKAQANRTPADNIANPVYNSFQSLLGGYCTIVVKQAGTNTVVSTTSLDATLLAGGAFTILLVETHNSSGNTFTPYLLQALQ
jgi:Domain of unknown function (DUF4397)